MSESVQIDDSLLDKQQVQASPWGFASKIAFRICLLYFGLYCLFTQLLGGLIPIPTLEMPDVSTSAPFRQIVFWTAEHIFRYQQAVVFTGSGSGDKVFDWVLSFCLLAVAFVSGCIWSALDRRRVEYNLLYQCFRVFIRFALAGQLFSYGLVKIMPMQMQFPYLARLLEPYGDFSPMGVLWSSIGASPAYERFVGSAEVLAGLLLIVPVTSMLGALVCFVDMVEVFVLNMTYDVPVKLLSFHLMLMAAFLLIPERSRFVRFCLLNCAVTRSETYRWFARTNANRIATTGQILFGLMLFAASLYSTLENWSKWGGGAPKSAFYGIWNVDEMSIDGRVRAPLLTDYGRWRRVIFEFPQWTSFERMDDSFAAFGTSFDGQRNTLMLTKYGDKKWKGELAVQRRGVSAMTLEGEMGNERVHMQLSLTDRSKFTLVSRGFHWIQDYPFNR